MDLISDKELEILPINNTSKEVKNEDNVYSKLEQLGRLRDSRVITEDELNSKKAKLLKEI